MIGAIKSPGLFNGHNIEWFSYNCNNSYLWKDCYTVAKILDLNLLMQKF